MYNNNNTEAIRFPSSAQRLDFEEESDESITENFVKKRIFQITFDFACIIITFVAFILVYLYVDPKNGVLFCNDTDIFNPYYDDTIAFWVVGIYATIGPILFIIFIELINSKLILCKNKLKITKKRKLFVISFLHGLTLFILGIGITLLVTEIGKRWVGRLRPHFMSVCKPNYASLNCTTTYGANEIYNPVDTSNICTGLASAVKEARVSFPSGHSSYSTYCMLFLIIYIQARLHLLVLRFLKPLFQMTAFIAAYVTCLSRISDYHHRGSDVIGGVVVGVIVAVLVTFGVGRVIWEYNYKPMITDFSLKKSKN